MRLLTSGPGVAHSTIPSISYAGLAAAALTTNATTNVATMKIRPRGLINSGNMCFANSVLQIMVYCPPFHRLFAELGRVLGAGGLNGVGGKTEGTAAEESAYPLVEATVEFLREFVVDDKPKEKDSKEKGQANANASVNGRVASTSASTSISASGSSSRSSSSRGKGKERERANSVNVGSGGGEMRDEDDAGAVTESFLPTYVYDAMKVKKRFEHMRVSFFFLSFFFLLCSLCFLRSSFPILLSSLLSLFFFFISSHFIFMTPDMTILIQGGHQEDAEEFFGFYLDTLEEELLAMLAAVSAPASSTSPNPTTTTTSSLGKNAPNVKHVVAAAASSIMESESVVSHEDADGDGWMEVGKRNRTVVTRTVCFFFVSFFGVPFLVLPCIFLPSFLAYLIYLFTYLLPTQIKGTESPITRIFGGKFRSTLRAPGQKDSVLVEDWRALRLDIQVRCCVVSLFLQKNIGFLYRFFFFFLARPNPHHSRCVVVHLASADCTNRFAYAIAISVARLESSTSCQRQRPQSSTPTPTNH